MRRLIHFLFPSAVLVAIVAACTPTLTEDTELVLVEAGVVDVQDVVIDGLVASWTVGAARGTPLSESMYADVLKANLRGAFASMNGDPGKYSVVLSRSEPDKEFEVSLVERDAEQWLVFADGIDSCEISADAGWREKRRWGNCMEDLMGGGGGGGICMRAETVREAGDDGEYGTDDDIFVTTCAERDSFF